jgi:zinc-ribbon domain/Sel1 repeat
LVCPKCGEDNSPTFRFCGMCGTALEGTRPPSTLPVANNQIAARSADVRAVERPRDSAPGRDPATTIAGPSLLGLGPEPEVKQRGDAPMYNTFSNLGSYDEPEESHNGRRILLLLVLLAALGAAGWWTYRNYLGAMSVGSRSTDATPAAKPTPATPITAEAPPAGATAKPEAPAAPSEAADAAQPQASAPPKQQIPPQAAATAAAQPVMEVKPTHPRPVRNATLSAAKVSAEPVADNGDSDYRRGEAYLYGRGVAENCDQAVKHLKQASAQQNAKARSTFGTMYATGHCVPRDLPSAYGWFALALRVDPNNQILEKDLTAVWNQMTPPERESATRFKP